MNSMVVRTASHAGSWYTDKRNQLSKQLDIWLSQVPQSFDGIGPLPQPGSTMIIAPHAGYSYSGPAAAWAYKALDFSQAKRIFLLGPSHHFYLKGCALSQCTHYSTPLGDLKLDLGTIDELQQMGKFSKMSQDVDEDEHSLEMHLPYIYQMLSKSFSRPADFPALIPILVGNTTPSKEREYGSILAPYLQDPTSIFIVSSDFCHWGLRFGYTYYLPQATTRLIEGIKLSATSKLGQGCQISESIDRLDHITMEAIESGDHSAFTQILQSTGNTVCGRHPIGIAMCALESLHKDQSSTGCPSPFRFIRYEQSSRCAKVGDSSVSYASAFAAVQGRTRDALGD